jgi:hypothetical protein
MDASVCLARTEKYIATFMDHQTYSIQQLKVYQAVIASVYPHIPPIVTNIIIQKSFQTRQLLSALPKDHTAILTNVNSSNKVRYIQSSTEPSTIVNVVRESHVKDYNQ